MTRGVALIITNEEGLLLILTERQGKEVFGKLAGMRTIPMETAHREESDSEALERLIAEEVTGLALAGAPRFLGSYILADGRAEARLYAGEVETGSLLPIPHDADVGDPCWVRPSQALAFELRPGAREMIEDWQAGRRAVRCTVAMTPSERI